MIYFRGAKSLRFLSVFICYNDIVEKVEIPDRDMTFESMEEHCVPP